MITQTHIYTLIPYTTLFRSKFVEGKEYEAFQTSKYPNKKLVIVSCMDTRLVELLPRALNVSNGDVKIVKVAGAIVSHPFGAVIDRKSTRLNSSHSSISYAVF